MLCWDRWSLSFVNEEAECGFVLSRQPHLVSNMLTICTLTLLYTSSSLVGMSVFPTAFVDVVENSDLPRYRCALVLLMVVTCIMGIFAAKSTRIRHSLGAYGLERVVSLWILLIMFLIMASHPWYVASTLGRDPELSVADKQYTHDADLLLKVSTFLMGCHIALPLRWIYFLPSEIGACLCYVVLALAFKSPMPRMSIMVYAVLISAVAAAMSFGKWSLEGIDRAGFQRVAHERTLRYETEHQLDRVKAAVRSEDPDCHTVSSMGSSFAETAVLFNSLKKNEGDLKQKLQGIAELGIQEKWLIHPSDIQLQSQDILGSGSFGMVSGARYHGIKVAVKAPRAPPDHDPSAKFASIVHELRIFRRLRHPNIVQFHGACVVPTTGEMLLVLDFVDGKPLDSFMSAPPVTLLIQDRCTLAHGLCSALRYLHAQHPSIVHGDIKGSNALVDLSSGGLKARFVDFGLSRLLTRHAEPLGGSEGWMAPEVMHNVPCSPAPSADVFSFGRLLYLVFTSRLPVASFDLTSASGDRGFSRKYTLVWPDTAALKDECQCLCAACTQDDPSLRPDIIEVHETLVVWQRLSGEALATHEDSTGDLCLALEQARCFLKDERLQSKLDDTIELSTLSSAKGWSYQSLSLPSVQAPSQRVVEL